MYTHHICCLIRFHCKPIASPLHCRTSSDPPNIFQWLSLVSSVPCGPQCARWWPFWHAQLSYLKCKNPHSHPASILLSSLPFIRRPSSPNLPSVISAMPVLKCACIEINTATTTNQQGRKACLPFRLFVVWAFWSSHLFVFLFSFYDGHGERAPLRSQRSRPCCLTLPLR